MQCHLLRKNKTDFISAPCAFLRSEPILKTVGALIFLFYMISLSISAFGYDQQSIVQVKST